MVAASDTDHECDREGDEDVLDGGDHGVAAEHGRVRVGVAARLHGHATQVPRFLNTEVH